jgi:hypothetical protein
MDVTKIHPFIQNLGLNFFFFHYNKYDNKILWVLLGSPKTWIAYNDIAIFLIVEEKAKNCLKG